MRVCVFGGGGSGDTHPARTYRGLVPTWLIANPKLPLRLKRDAEIMPRCVSLSPRLRLQVLAAFDIRPLFQVVSGQFFGESVITGRRRESTCVANSACEMLSLSFEDLEELFTKFPAEGQKTCQAVMKTTAKHDRCVLTPPPVEGGGAGALTCCCAPAASRQPPIPAYRP